MNSHDEIVQGYNERCEPTAGITKTQVRAGESHGAAHVWLWREAGGQTEILVQKRAAHKATWPDHYDVSAAGHMRLGETPLAAALRETAEEIGLQLPASALRLLFVHRANLVDSTSGTTENEFQWVYGAALKPSHEFTLQRDEVGSLKWLPLDEFQMLIDGQTPDKFVPHGLAYFTELLKEISGHH